ncbi:MAG TPA: hypothetical protein PLD20_08775 [Blastocatellia bacterium]|nr:hypothetical protein [Blastocatellia bacterium]HMV83689.1 hypothetical protein [Blastocatellia bacterium]HMX24843.1 hypothetical protein [Blastocatellia bacterium]HMY72613.1 hypothetical protein [Blastocatellia bacterium]HMZ18009.1 hypothetical protein [Blastocatellia bacterium]
MQWRLHIKGADDLQGELSLARLATFEASAIIQPLVALAAKVIQEHHGEVFFDGCVFGNEFCEHLLPSAASLRQALAAAQSRNLAFTLLTPYVGNEGITALRPLFDALAEQAGNEVVFNDWGVLNLLRRDYPTLRPVQGRLLNKSLRDPRVTTMYAAAPAPASALNVLQGSNLDNASYAMMLRRFGVEMIEMDNLPQGNDLNVGGLAIAIYLPFGFISTSRVCMAAGLHYHKADKFQPGAPCRHECQTHLLEYQYTNSPFGNRDQKFYLKGNSYFYHHSEPMLRALPAQAAQGRIARLIFQPRLPMIAI